MMQKFVALLAVSLILTACAKDETNSASVDSNGFCTSGFVEKYNNVVMAFRNYADVYSAANLDEKAVSEAAVFVELSGNALDDKDTACKALDLDSNKVVTVTGADLNLNIASASSVLNLKRASKPLPQKADVFNGKEKISLLRTVSTAQ